MSLVKRTVDLTQEDIDNGVPGWCDKCPGYLAISRAFPELGGRVRVSWKTVFYSPRVHARQVPVPSALLVFINLFDSSGPQQRRAKPFSFELELDLS
jgi:hypothetical protein